MPADFTNKKCKINRSIKRAKPTNLESAMIAHSINNDTSQNQIAKKVLLTLENANKDISRFLKMTDGVYTKKRYNEIKKQLTEISKNLAEDINENIDVDNYLENELKEVSKIYKKVGGFSNLQIPTLEQVKSAATFIPYTEYGTFDSFLKNTESQFFNVWDSAVRTGYMTGQTTSEIVRNVMGSPAKDAQLVKMGSIQSLRNSVMANTRTVLQSFATETRNEIFRKNDDLFDGYKWYSTLDRRTCLVCGNLDGKKFRKLENIQDMPPVHHNCRCIVLAYINEFEDLDDTRSSENGQVDSKITYKDWLDSQSDKIKEQVLGKGRFELYKQGFEVGDFVNRGRIIPITTPVGMSITEKNYFKNNEYLKINGAKESNEEFDIMTVKQLKEYESIDKAVKLVNPNYYKYSNANEYRVNCQRTFVAMEMRIRQCDVVAQPCYDKDNDYIAKHIDKVFNLKKEDIKPYPSIDKVLEDFSKHKDAYARYGLEYSYYDEKNKIKRHIIMVERQMKNLQYYDGQTGRKIDIETLKNNAFMIKLYRVDNTELTGLAKYCYFER